MSLSKINYQLPIKQESSKQLIAKGITEVTEECAEVFFTDTLISRRHKNMQLGLLKRQCTYILDRVPIQVDSC